MSRLYGDKEDINSDKVKDFFNERANREFDNDLSIVLFQEKEISEQRYLEGKKLLNENIDISGKKVLEVGCGIGRWIEALHDKCESFLGIDYSENLIDIANEYNTYDNCKFQVMSAFDIKEDELLIEPPFDVVIITGVLMYINDKDLLVLFDELNKVCSDDKKLFILEPVSSMDVRLTLKDFYSEGLNADYNAIYRTPEEYLEAFKNLNCNKISSEEIYKDLNDHSETKYMIFIIE